MGKLNTTPSAPNLLEATFDFSLTLIATTSKELPAALAGDLNRENHNTATKPGDLDQDNRNPESSIGDEPYSTKLVF